MVAVIRMMMDDDDYDNYATIVVLVIAIPFSRLLPDFDSPTLARRRFITIHPRQEALEMYKVLGASGMRCHGMVN